MFFTPADLLSLDVDLLFFDTTSTYFELDFEDGKQGQPLLQRAAVVNAASTAFSSAWA